jgi:hypothetical protein
VNDDRMLFDRVLEQALGGETLEELMTEHADAVGRGNWERVRFLDDMVRTASIRGTNAVTAERTRRERN